MKGMHPRLAFSADNKLADDNTKLGVELRFNSLEDFEPAQVASQVEPLRKLMEVRRQLSGLLAKADSNERLADKLQEILTNTELAGKLHAETQPASDGGGEKK